jgi:formate hydrogenlyase subunit 3/multisubunit Na+/H+ antiporter MnhD subunit
MSWPLAQSSHRPLAVPRRMPRIVWVLVAAAFLCGGLLSAAGFAVGWRHQAQRGTSAESALVAATATAHSLQARLAAARIEVTALRARSQTLATGRRAAARAEAALRARLAAVQQSLAAVTSAAAPLTGDLDRLRSELHALSSYLSSTPAGQLDAGYVQAQLAYLTKTVDGFSAAVAVVAAPGH